jgi:glycerol-3-phosphate O-acyltransferase / dihydroxyacetone phosphate acyltransferase
MLRLTAKATQFGHKTFTSWLIESAGTVPIKRKKDYPDGNVDNSDVMENLVEVCFPLDSVIPYDNGDLSVIRH